MTYGPREIPQERPSKQAVTVLMVSASPDIQVRLRVDHEFREIIARMRSTRHRDQFRFEQVQAVRFDDLRTALMEYQPQVLHISSHGKSDGALIFEGDNESICEASARNILQLLTSLRDNLELVVINACDSHELARSLSSTIGVAVGMNDKINDATAIRFAVALYEGLGFGKAIETAFNIAVAGLEAAEADIPVLFPLAADDPQRRRSKILLNLDRNPPGEQPAVKPAADCGWLSQHILAPLGLAAIDVILLMIILSATAGFLVCSFG